MCKECYDYIDNQQKQNEKTKLEGYFSTEDFISYILNEGTEKEDRRTKETIEKEKKEKSLLESKLELFDKIWYKLLSWKQMFFDCKTELNFLWNRFKIQWKHSYVLFEDLYKYRNLKEDVYNIMVRKIKKYEYWLNQLLELNDLVDNYLFHLTTYFEMLLDNLEDIVWKYK